MKKQIAALSCLVLLSTFSGFGSAQVGRSSTQVSQGASGAFTVPLTIVDEKGQAIKPESLPKDAQAQLERVRRAAEGLATGSGSDGAAQRVKVTISCRFSPLSCTITIQF